MLNTVCCSCVNIGDDTVNQGGICILGASYNVDVIVGLIVGGGTRAEVVRDESLFVGRWIGVTGRGNIWLLVSV